MLVQPSVHDEFVERLVAKRARDPHRRPAGRGDADGAAGHRAAAARRSRATSSSARERGRDAADGGAGADDRRRRLVLSRRRSSTDVDHDDARRARGDLRPGLVVIRVRGRGRGDRDGQRHAATASPPAVWTQRRQRAPPHRGRAATRARCGSTPTARGTRCPVGGYKKSGYGRENGIGGDGALHADQVGVGQHLRGADGRPVRAAVAGRAAPAHGWGARVQAAGG